VAEVRIIEGDCLEALPTLETGSVDAVVTDPPYSLDFMGKKWDAELPGIEHWRAVLRALKPGGYLLAFGGTRTYHRLACAVEDAGFEVRDCLMWLYGSGFPKGKGCLKPAYEPILLARRPGPRVLLLGVDECRVPAERNDLGDPARFDGLKAKCSPGWLRPHHATPVVDERQREAMERAATLGRYPGNLAHDGSDEVLEAFAAFGERKSGGKPGATYERPPGGNCYGEGKTWGAAGSHSDAGSAARFFYCAKASKSERGEGNTHPTVKPLSLLCWLVRLVCPPGGTVLDPFAGSGTTGGACLREGRNAVLIEREPAYVEILRRRLAAETDPGPLFSQRTLELTPSSEA
jgi:hypothetical protein